MLLSCFSDASKLNSFIVPSGGCVPCANSISSIFSFVIVPLKYVFIASELAVAISLFGSAILKFIYELNIVFSGIV